MNKKLFILILFLAFLLRFYKLGSVPFSLDWDEVSNGYNAYSILKTARDEYGKFLPLANRSFDDYKPPVYMYLNIPAIAIFGLNEFSVRLPSALFGFLTVPLIFLLANFLFHDDKNRNKISLIAMFLFTISPWHLQFSRVGFEANVGLFFTVLTITALLYGLKKHSFIILSAIASVLSLYSYHTQKIFIPLILISIFFIYKKEILAIPKKILISFICIIFIFTVPMLILLPKQALFSRLQSSSLSTRQKEIENSAKYIKQDYEKNFKLGKYIHSSKVFFLLDTASNYLANYDLNFLFVSGDDNGRHHVENMGMFYLFQLPLFAVGVYLLLTNLNKSTKIIFSWLLIAPIASSLATPSPHAIRSLPLLPVIEIICSTAAVNLFNIKNNKNKTITFAFCAWIIVSFLLYLHNYHVHYPVDKADAWQYGFKEAVIESSKLKDSYDKIKINSSLEQAYIYWLFYTKYDPKLYQISGSNQHFDKYYFNAEKPESNKDLFVSSMDTPTYPKDFIILKTIVPPNNKQAISLSHHP